MTPWEKINRIFAEADVIEKLIRLYRESGVSWEEARRMALEKWRESQPAQER